MNKQRYLLVVSGPSGCGKDTVVRRMIRQHPGIELSVSATTRAPREGERDGVDYHFVTKEQFEQYIAEDRLAEFASYVNNYYGTLKSEVEERIGKGTVCVLVIEVNGAARIKQRYPECTTVFILPPSMEELERRLRGRGTESEERLQERLLRAREEMKLAGTYDFTVMNDDLQTCVDDVYEILQKRLKQEL